MQTILNPAESAPAKRRQWTADDQLTAEAMRELGASWRTIGRTLGWDGESVRRFLVPGVAEAKRESSRRRYQQNPEAGREQNRRRREQNPEAKRERDRRYYQQTAEARRECSRRHYQQNPEPRREYSRIYRQQNPESVRESCCRWRQQNAEAIRERKRRYYQQNLEAIRERGRRYYRQNLEARRESGRLYREQNPDAVRVAHHRWYQQNLEVIRDRSRRWRERNPDAVRENNRRWAAANPEKAREHVRRRRTLKRAGRLIALDPLTLSTKMARFAIWGNRCAYCAITGKQTVEHVLALNQGGLDEPSNVAPACLSCNCSKGERPVEEWYRKQPCFSESRWHKLVKHCPAAIGGQLPLGLSL